MTPTTAIALAGIAIVLGWMAMWVSGLQTRVKHLEVFLTGHLEGHSHDDRRNGRGLRVVK